MKFFLSEIFRIYKRDPLKISVIWLMDLFQSLIIAASPYIIGKCIDDLLQQKYVWLIILISLEILFGISQAANNWLDTRVYSRIVEEEHTLYYSHVVNTEEDSSLISARLSKIKLHRQTQKHGYDSIHFVIHEESNLYESKKYVFFSSCNVLSAATPSAPICLVTATTKASSSAVGAAIE